MSDKIYENLIGGRWVGGSDFNENRSPSNVDELIGLYARANVDEVGEAVAAAKESLIGWSMVSPPQVRADLLERVGNAILARKEELGAVACS